MRIMFMSPFYTYSKLYGPLGMESPYNMRVKRIQQELLPMDLEQMLSSISMHPFVLSVIYILLFYYLSSIIYCCYSIISYYCNYTVYHLLSTAVKVSFLITAVILSITDYVLLITLFYKQVTY